MVNCKSPSNHQAEYVLLFPTHRGSKFKKLKCLDHMNFRVSLFLKDIAGWIFEGSCPCPENPIPRCIPFRGSSCTEGCFFFVFFSPDFDAWADWKQFECSPSKTRAVFQSTFSSHTVGTPTNDGDRCSTPEKPYKSPQLCSIILLTKGKMRQICISWI